MPGLGRPVYRLYQWLWAGLDLLYPPACAGCGRQGVRWCADCQRQVYLILPPLCEICGRDQKTPGLCPHCRENPPHFRAIRSWAVFDGAVRNALHRLKYRRDVSLGETLARPLVQIMQSLEWKPDLVTPVPLSKERLRERGYNQAALLARPVALGMGLPYHPRALRKARHTRSQVDLSAAERRANVKDAFQASPRWVTGKSVLVVDDVTTTNATLDACAAALLEAGAIGVYGLTVGRAGHP